MNLDSLRLTVQVLSGEVGSKNGGASDTIRSRWYTKPGNSLAKEYLRANLEKFGLAPQDQVFAGPFSVQGINVFAEQAGDAAPEYKYILSAHFDSVSDSDDVAPGADDNASGCAVIVEAARVLSKYRPACTIVYALWDQEEVGTWGSNYYAKEARARGDSIVGVVNLDMLGWDDNNDGLLDIHASNIGQSVTIAEKVVFVSQLYDSGLVATIYNPGSSGSDHASFWRRGYSAILLSEAYSGGDFSPHNHKTTDRLEVFNPSYFHRMAKLAIGSIASLAGVQRPVGVSSAELLPFAPALYQNYPNPFNPSTTIRYGLSSRIHVALTVFNTLGQQVLSLVHREQDAGYHEVKFDGSSLPSGVYFYRMQAGNYSETKKLLLMR